MNKLRSSMNLLPALELPVVGLLVLAGMVSARLLPLAVIAAPVFWMTH